MTQMIRGTARELRAVLDGPVLHPGGPGFEEARQVWNADIDRRPAMIAQCTSAGDVATAIRFARQGGLEIASCAGARTTARAPRSVTGA